MGLWDSSLAVPRPDDNSQVPEAHPVYTDLLTFCFDGSVQYDHQRPLFIDAQDSSRSLNACQFRLLVRTLIAGLKAHHVQRGDSVLVHLGNNIIYPALFFAIIGAGGVFMGSNARSQPQELEHILQLAEPKLIITSREALPTVLNVSVARGMLSSQVCLLDEYAPDHIAQLLVSGPLAYSTAHLPFLAVNAAEYLNFAHLLGYGENDWVSFDDEAIAKATPAAMFSTSGTGGLPKAALLSHHAIVSQHLSIHYDVPYEVTRLMCLPMFHLFGALWTHIFPIRYGQPLLVLPRFELTQFVAAVYQYRISETYMVPAMIHVFNRSASPVAAYLATLRYVGVAGAPIDGASLEQFEKLLHPHARAHQIWGMTEVGVVFQTRYGAPGNHGSIGTRTPGYEVRLVGQDGNLVQGERQPGELYVRGAGVLIGYKGRSDAKDAYGWFRTGDVAYVQNGEYFIVGRTKELIKVRGWQVAPAELEAVLIKHPLIEDAAVTGVMSQDGSTEVPRAFVVKARGSSANRLTAEEVYLFARQQLASYKALDGGVIFVEEIPRTASGKIQRFKLSQMNTYREMVTSLLARFKGATSGFGGLGLMHKGRLTV
ncbi:adenylate-forming enzyme AfeA [Aspergillus clavatus NRRL 1]|uniref:Adenylate-forming enzyme AfeA n=1 Tax=Aspergillus clavatus (strain ATCC 1007 / CBS 513.65 / DSM 816 / NCTC 3887 / NRRL 1 / QM 1276 / 107) TaxID=344612 RepID=A1CBJ7_ASPCL|nr:adenylate-forming enzyme AfeA [Aspergillus clavatus NRRL 1]EAW13115.1 adenylate-forming enzyme AfeA [Aspergillus clavatus NRRL 1]